MGIGVLAIIALLGLGLAAAGAPPAKPKVKKKPVSKVKIVKKKPTRPPKKKEKKAAKKIKEAKIPRTKKGTKIVKQLTKIVVKDDPKTHPIVKKAAKEKIKSIAKTPVDLSEVAKLFRAKPTMGFPHVFRSKKTGAQVWANKKGGDALRAKGTHTYVKFDRKYATDRQRREFDAAMKAFAKPPPRPGAPKYDLAEIAKFFRAKATHGFPYVYQNKANKQLVWTNQPGATALRGKGTHTFVRFDGKLATNRQMQEWQAAMKALAPDGPTPVEPEVKREIIKEVIKSEDTPPTPSQAAKALQIYTREGGWQGDKSKPSQVVYDCQKRMGDPAPDGIIGQGTRTRARDLGYPLYARSHTAPGAYKKAEPLTRY